MTLRERILILLFSVFCGYWGLEYAAYRWVVEPRLEQLEHSIARQQAQKCERALNDEARDLQEFAERFSIANDLQSVLQRSILPDDVSEKADMLCLADEAGRWAAFAVRKGVPAVPDANDFLNELRKGKSPVILNTPCRFSQKGMVASTAGPLLIGSSPCTTFQAGGAKPATLIAGRFITPRLIDSLRKQIYTDFTCTPYTPKSATRLAEELGYVPGVGGNDFFYRRLDEELLQCYTALPDMAGKPVLILRADVSGEALRGNRRVLYMAGYIHLAAAIPAIVILTILFQIIVVVPILRLIQDIVAIGKGQFVRRHRSKKRRDEIGILAREFDQMLKQLDAAQKKLVEKSFVSGMAEMSSGILHNARNALSPVVSGLERMGEKVATMNSPELQQAMQEVERSGADPQRKANLQRFLLLSMQEHQRFLYQTRKNLDELAQQVYQVEEVLNGQQSFGGAAKPLESIGLKQLVEEAVELIPANLRAGVRISVDSKMERLRPIHVHRVVFLQVLENLLINAAESLVLAGPLYPKIKVSGRVELIDNIEMLCLEIEDNGAGIEPEIMKKLFERDTSTKPRGMTGIGLHWCANAIAAMKGRIWAESNGKNRGACFHIVMPVLQDKESLIVNEEKGADHESEHKTQDIGS